MCVKIVAIPCDSVAETARFEACLSAVSDYARSRILSLKDEDDRRRRLCAAAALDACLQTVGLRETDVTVATGEHGKPFLPAYPDVHFSVSHSGNWAVCALDAEAVGIDVERLRAVRYKALAARHFTAEENAWLAAQADERRAFFRLWTAKESVLKAHGTGLSGGLSTPITCGERFAAPPWRLKEYALPDHVLTACGRGAFPEEITIISSCDSVLLR